MDPLSPASHLPTSPVPVASAPFKWRRLLVNRVQEAGWALFFVTVFASGYAQALSIHDFRVTSRLGEPLDATIVVEALPGEQLAANCITTGPGAAGDLPAITGIRLSLTRSLTPGTIRLSTTRAVREPIGQIVLTVDCPGTPNVSRTFMVMLDPPSADEPSAPVAAQTARPLLINRPSPVTTSVARYALGETVASPVVRTNRSAASTRPRIRRAAAGDGSPIAPGSQYMVRDGDALSLIAARVQGRPSNSVWPIARAIHQANPGAFLLGDPNVITAGARLYIPTLDQSLGAGAMAAALSTPAASITAGTSRRPSITDDEPVVSAQATTRNSLTIPVVPAPERNDIPVAAAVAIAASARSRVITKPLETMALTTSLSALSVNRLHLRRTGVLQVATSATTSPKATDNHSSPAPAPTPANGQDAPASTTTVTRQVAPAPVARNDGLQVSWSMLGGLLILLLALAAAGVGFMRRQLRIAYTRDVREALRRRRYAEQLRESREGYEQDDDRIVVHETTEPGLADAADETDDTGHAPTVIVPAAIIDVGDPDAQPDSRLIDADPLGLAFPELGPLPSADAGDDTVETGHLGADMELDLELPAVSESSALISDETLQLSLGEDRTTELAAPGDQFALDESAELQIDAELLALDYSQQFEASRSHSDDADDTQDLPVQNDADDDASDTTEVDIGGDADLLATDLMLQDPSALPTSDVAPPNEDPGAYYHLEVREQSEAEPLSFESDEAKKESEAEPLSFESDDDDDDEGSRVVAFRGRE